MAVGMHIVTPPKAWTMPWNPARSTYRTWLILSPLSSSTVFATSCAPPPSRPPENAALILSNPRPGMFTQRSRGNESTIAFCRRGSVCTSMITSERFEPPMSASVPNWSCSSALSPARESLPRIR